MVPIQYRPQGGTVKEIAQSIELAIRTGGFVAGQPLPTIRGLATDLDVAPGTVAHAFRLLRDRGLVETRGRAGTFVRPRLTDTLRSAVRVGADLVDLATGQPDPRLLPDLGPALRRLGSGPAAAPATGRSGDLVAAARTRLTAEGVPAHFLTVTSGGLDALHRLLSAQLRPGDAVAIEDPGWPHALDLVANLGLRAHPLAMDEAGPTADALDHTLAAGVVAVLLTNRAQNPTGACLRPDRARELRAVLAGHPEILVIEDDHAAELAGVELVTLAGTTERWAFVRSVSKPYGPDLRVALVAGDEATIVRLDSHIQLEYGWVSTLLQRLVVELWRDPSVDGAIADAAVAYQQRRATLIGELARRGIPAHGATGLNVWVPARDETAVVAGLAAAGWAVAPGSHFRQASAPGVRITVSNLDTSTISPLADDLVAVLDRRSDGGATAR